MKTWLSAITLILASVLVFPKSVYAAQTYQVGDVLFTDDFNDGNFNGWTVQSGTWGIDSLKRLYGFQFGTLKTGNIAPSGSWANYRIEADVQNNEGVDEAVNFRYTNDNNTYSLNLRHRLSTQPDTPEVILYKAVNGTTTQITETHNITLEHYIPYHVTIECVGNHIQVWIDNNLIFDFDDTTTPLTTGGIALKYWTGNYGADNVRFDNVKVTELSPIPKTPVIFIPGVGGSELQTNSATDWSYDNGHNGTYNHLYPANEVIWVNQNEAAKPGNDDYFDVLKLKPNGTESIADITPTGNLISQGYPGLDSFFANLGYSKGTDYFTFAYDWRKDASANIADLDQTINTALQKTAKSKVNIIAHSLGGLVARSYINESTNSAKINKLIELGVPHLGSVKALKTIMYGEAIAEPFLGIIPIGIPATEIKDISNNLPSIFDLIPSKKYYDMHPSEYAWAFYPFSDESDIDQNGETGILDYTRLKTLLTNIGTNMTVYQSGENLHDNLDDTYSSPLPFPTYICVGNGFPTLGQIRETYLITWPTNLIPKVDQIYINGDDTVPSSSAALKNAVVDYAGNAIVHYSNQRHSDLANPTGGCMQQTTNWLQDTPAQTPPSTPSTLDGTQITVDSNALIDLTDGSGRATRIDQDNNLVQNIPGTLIDQASHSTIVFISNSSGSVTATVRPTDTTSANITTRHYQKDTVDYTNYYQNLDLTKPITLKINPSANTPDLTVANIDIQPTGSASGSAALDISPPTTTAVTSGNIDSSGNFVGSVSIKLTASDSSGSGILKTNYSIGETATPSAYLMPITLSNTGTYTIYYSSIDRLGNQEDTRTLTFTIVSNSTASTDSSSTGTTVSDSLSSSNNPPDNTSNNSTSNTDQSPSITTYQTNPLTEFVSSHTPVVSITNNDLKAVLGVNSYSIHLDWLQCLVQNYHNLLRLFAQT